MALRNRKQISHIICTPALGEYKLNQSATCINHLISSGQIPRSSPTKSRFFKKSAYFWRCDYRHSGLFFSRNPEIGIRFSPERFIQSA